MVITASKHIFENHPFLTRPYGPRLVTERTPKHVCTAAIGPTAIVPLSVCVADPRF